MGCPDVSCEVHAKTSCAWVPSMLRVSRMFLGGCVRTSCAAESLLAVCSVHQSPISWTRRSCLAITDPSLATGAWCCHRPALVPPEKGSSHHACKRRTAAQHCGRARARPRSSSTPRWRWTPSSRSRCTCTSTSPRQPARSGVAHTIFACKPHFTFPCSLCCA